MTEEYYEAVRKWTRDKRAEVKANPGGAYLGPYGITVDQKQAAIEEINILNPYKIYVLKHVAHLLNSLDVPWFISDGTLLGWYRSKSMIAYDNDIDLSMFEADMLKVWKNRHLLPEDVHVTCADPGRPEFNWCTDDACQPFDWSKNSIKKLGFSTTNIPPMPSNPIGYWGAWVDLFTYQLSEDTWHNNYAYDGMIPGPYPKSCVLPLQKSTFEGIDVWVPNNPKEWLEVTYGYIGENAVWDEATKLYKPQD